MSSTNLFKAFFAIVNSDLFPFVNDICEQVWWMLEEDDIFCCDLQGYMFQAILGWIVRWLPLMQVLPYITLPIFYLTIQLYNSIINIKCKQIQHTRLPVFQNGCNYLDGHYYLDRTYSFDTVSQPFYSLYIQDNKQTEPMTDKINGEFTLSNSDQYQGELEITLKQKEGHGIYIWTHGDRFNGNWHQDKMCGFGVYNFSNGSIYQGEFFDGEIQGRGKLLYVAKQDDDIVEYKGQWQRTLPHGKGEAIYKNGDIYRGDFVNGLRGGYGEYEFNTDFKYEGEWKENFFHGKGKLFRKRQLFFDGQFQNGLKNGLGMYRYQNSDHFQGTFCKDEKRGHGLYYFYEGRILQSEFSPNPSELSKIILSNKAVYIGGHKSGTRQGKGRIDYPDGTWYEGDWKNDKKHGEGTFSYLDNSKYVGHWDQDTRKGHGIYYYPNGDVYEGDWDRDLQHGNGSLFYANGDSYKGEWRYSKMHGQGIYTYHENRALFKGKWKDGKKTGFGQLTLEDVYGYSGEWRQNQKQGKGAYLYPNGDKYEGDWLQDRKHGQGQYIYSNGDIYRGSWKEDIRHGRGIMKYANHSIYEGQWHNGKRQGGGLFIFPNGHSYEGKWQNDKFHGRGLIKKQGVTFEVESVDGKLINYA